MRHFGDIKELSGYTLPAVDCITFGAPCQDISVAGRRAGMKHEGRGDEVTTRSGLFFEAVRIIEEMRERDRSAGRPVQFIRPRFAVYENVPGALSSPGKGHKGEDFAAVIEELIKVAEPGAAVSVRVPNGGWPKSGCYYAEDGSWSIAYRVFDAQFWGASVHTDDGVQIQQGTPQRRRRIALVADFGGLAAPEVLFERDSLLRHSGESEEAGEEATRAVGGRVESAKPLVDAAGFCSGHSPDSWSIGYEEEISPSIRGSISGDMKPCVCDYRQEAATYDARGNGDGNVVCTITGDHNNRVTDYTALVLEGSGDDPVLPFDTTQITHPANYSHPKPGDPCHPLAAGAHPPAVAIGNGQLNQISMSETANCLDTMHDAQAVIVFDKEMYNYGDGFKGEPQAREDDVSPTVRADTHPSGVAAKNVVRRLTPMECERLQGYPDNWTDVGPWIDTKGKRHRESSDSSRYKALGNSICLPFWFYLLRRISAQYQRPAMLGSLFDGISGFPLAWERCNGSGTAIWSSEIDEFARSVAKYHFPEE